SCKQDALAPRMAELPRNGFCCLQQGAGELSDARARDLIVVARVPRDRDAGQAAIRGVEDRRADGCHLRIDFAVVDRETTFSNFGQVGAQRRRCRTTLGALERGQVTLALGGVQVGEEGFGSRPSVKWSPS